VTQLMLIEPLPLESIPLAVGHLKQAEKFRSQALIADSRGWPAVASVLLGQAEAHELQADELAAYFDLCLWSGQIQ